MKHLLLTICLSTLFISCKKDKLEGDKEIFIGKWEWVYTIHTDGICTGYPPSEETITPETVGINYSMEFLKKGIVKYYENSDFIDKDRIVFSQFNGDSCNTWESYLRFSINLDNDSKSSKKSFDGCITNDTIILIRGFPFSSYTEGCEIYRSYFIKQ